MSLSETFWITFTGAGFAFLGLFIRYAYMSKCSHLRLCCVEIDRDVATELQEDLENKNTDRE
jgi:hypothetical protein